MRKIILINGMMCKKCVAHVQKALEKIPDTKIISISLENGTAEIESLADDTVIKQTLTETGFACTGIETKN
jgi:copper chaperone CopZ